MSGSQLIVKARAAAPPWGAPALGMAAESAGRVPIMDELRAMGFGVRQLSPARAPVPGLPVGPPAAAAEGPGPGWAPDPLEGYFAVDAPEAEMLGLAERFRSRPDVEAAYVKPPTLLPQLNLMTAAPALPPAATPSFEPRQGYLLAAPDGVDASWAAGRPGARGEGVTVIDLEGLWQFTHESFRINLGGTLSAGVPRTDDRSWRNHGTAVVGEIFGNGNGIGITGIAPDVRLRAISIFPNGTAPAIRVAADILGAGDILLIEAHRPGPRHGFANRPDQKGFIAIEWWPDDFAAISYAVGRGVIVVAAAGNGGEDLDDALYDSPQPGFPSGWGNPFKRGANDSGSVLVGAGAPPPGTHGRNHGPDRSRLDFSNYGACLDAQGWGREVTTAGYGDLQGGPDEDSWYTDQFSGTSSASPIVVGALACVQGNRRATGGALLDPLGARALLRTSGSPQQAAPGRPVAQRIGNRPDLRAVIP